MSTTLDLTNIERAKLSNTGEDSDLSRLKAAGPRALPDNPTANKWSAAAIKRQLYMQPEILFGWLKRAIDAFAEFSEATAGLLSSGVVSGAEKDGNGNVITTTYAFDWNVVHFEGDERIYGTKEFVGTIKAASLLPYAGSSAIGDSEDGRWQIGYFKYVDLGYIKSGNLIFTLPNAGGVLVTEAGAQSIADGAKAQAVASAKTYTDGVKNSLQSEIDAINATQNVVDIVGTKANLTAYDTTELHEDDKIEVLADESQNGANTIYSWNGSAWTLIGSKAPYYSIAQITSILTDYVTNVSLANTLENYVTGTALSDALSNALSAYSTTAVCESTYAKIGDSYTKAESDAKHATIVNLSETNTRVTALESKTAKQESDIQYLYRQVIGGGDLVTQTDSGVSLTSQPFPLTVSPKALLDYVGGMCQKVNQFRASNSVAGNGSSAVNWYTIGYSATALVYGHKYFVSVETRTASGNVDSTAYRFKLGNPEYAEYSFSITNSAAWATTQNIGTLTLLGSAGVNASFFQHGDNSNLLSIEWRNLRIVDLTAIYGAGNEPTSTSDARIQWLMSYLSSHPEYDAGSIITAPVAKVVSKGFNLWDEETKNGFYYSQTGAYTEDNNQLCSKNAIRIKPNSTYYLNISASGFGFRFYDKDMNYIGFHNMDSAGTFTTPSNAYYVHINLGLAYGTTYKHDICINRSSSLNGTYKPYRAPIEYPISAEVQALEGYGYGLSADCYNYIDFEGKKFVKKVARVDLGTLTWFGDGNIKQSTSLSSVISAPTSNANVANIVCAKYAKDSANNVFNRVSEGIAVNTDGTIQVWDANYANVPATDFKVAMSGVYLYYELATPVETDISEYIDSDVIVVGAGGRLEFENEDDMGVPYSATYQCEANP